MAVGLTNRMCGIRARRIFPIKMSLLFNSSLFNGNQLGESWVFLHKQLLNESNIGMPVCTAVLTMAFFFETAFDGTLDSSMTDNACVYCIRDKRSCIKYYYSGAWCILRVVCMIATHTREKKVSRINHTQRMRSAEREANYDGKCRR